MNRRVYRPNKFMESFTDNLSGQGQLRILDIGCGQGENAFHLAGLGHQVMGVSNEETEIEQAQEHARRIQVSNCTFEVMDARELNEKLTEGFFHAVLISDMLHQMSKEDTHKTIKTAQSITTPNGYNAIHGYLVDPQKSTHQPNIERMFHAGELSGLYDTNPNWRVISDVEDEFQSAMHNGVERVGSHASLIAQKQRS